MSGCQWFNRGNEDKALARVDDRILFMDAVREEIDFTNAEDSANLIESYVDNWVKEQLLIKKAKQNLSEEEINFDRQLESYRNSLIIYAYENQLVSQKLDSQIADSSIKNYYLKNSSNFELKEPLIQGRFLQLIASAPKQDSIYKWISGNLIDYEEDLGKYCTQFASNCQLDTSKWTSITSLAGIFPTKGAADLLESISLGYNVISDSITVLILDVKSIAHAGKTAPMSYVEPKIRSIIRNKKRLKLIANAKKEIYEEATLKKKYEVYY